MIELNYIRHFPIYFCYKNSPCLISDFILILIPVIYFKNIYEINNGLSRKIDTYLPYQNFCLIIVINTKNQMKFTQKNRLKNLRN